MKTIKKLTLVLMFFIALPSLAYAEADGRTVGYSLCVHGYISAGAVDFFQRNRKIASTENLISMAIEVCETKKKLAIKSLSNEMQAGGHKLSDKKIGEIIDKVFLSDFRDTATKITRGLR